MPVAQHPPHRSVRERLTHTAPASDVGGIACPTTASAPHAVQRLGHGLPASMCGPCHARRRSPRPRPFPPDPPRLVPRPCSDPSPVLRPSPTPRRRTRGACGMRLPPPGLPLGGRASPRSPGSRAESFLTCTGSSTAPGPAAARAGAAIDMAFPSSQQGRPPKHVISRLNSPARQCLCQRFCPRCRHRRRMTRGQRGSLLLRCGAPSSSTLRRFIPALSDCPLSFVVLCPCPFICLGFPRPPPVSIVRC